MHQRIALTDVARYGAFLPRHALAGESLERAGLIQSASTDNAMRRWVLTKQGKLVLKGRGA